MNTLDKCSDAIEARQLENMVHPLLNPDSKHYSMVDGIEAISRMEDMYSKHELQIWAKITAMKYRLRIGNKDDAHKEVNKIKTYKAYYEYLEAQLKGNIQWEK